MDTLSNRLNSLSPSATLAMSQKSAELKAQGVDVINLSVGEPDFNPPDQFSSPALMAAALLWSGVLKSGSPPPRLLTSTP